MSLLIKEVVKKYDRTRQSVLYAIKRGRLTAVMNRSGQWEIDDKSAANYYTTNYSQNTKIASEKRMNRL